MMVGAQVQRSRYPAWRDDHLGAISAQLEDAVSSLGAYIDATINTQSTRDIIKGAHQLTRRIRPNFRPMNACQSRVAIQKADQAMPDAFSVLPL